MIKITKLRDPVVLGNKGECLEAGVTPVCIIYGYNNYWTITRVIIYFGHSCHMYLV